MALSTTEQAKIQADIEASFRDECQIGTRTETGTGPNVAMTFEYATAIIACGFDANKSKEVSDGSQATLTDAVTRVSLDAVIVTGDRVRITKRDGTTLATPETYAILGAPKRGIGCFMLNCQRLTGASVL